MDATFLSARCRQTSFARADLKQACFMFADADGSDFSSADLTGADFEAAEYHEAKFHRAILDGVALTRWYLTEAQIAGATADVRTVLPAGYVVRQSAAPSIRLKSVAGRMVKDDAGQ